MGKVVKFTHRDDVERAKKKKEDMSVLFEQYMISIGQWAYVNGQLTVIGSFMSSQSIQEDFKRWLAKKQ